MANVAARPKAACKARTIPAEGQILVTIEDMSMLKDIKKAISLLKGVDFVVLCHPGVLRTPRLVSGDASSVSCTSLLKK